jgi:hypothetical protein
LLSAGSGDVASCIFLLLADLVTEGDGDHSADAPRADRCRNTNKIMEVVAVTMHIKRLDSGSYFITKSRD